MINKALSQIGIKEIVGKKHNNEVLKYFKETGNEWVTTDETAWCSAFVNWVAKKSGYEFTGALNARSWLDIGEATDTPQIGDIVVLWRVAPSSWKGPVGFFSRETDSFIYILGGNQNNSVCIRAYPKKQLLEYRTLTKLPGI